MCFTSDTLIDTPHGPVPVQELHKGQKVLTRDNGVQAVTGVCKIRLKGQTLMDAPHLQPVHIRSEAFGDGLPETDMLVSPNQRVLVSKERTPLMFMEKDALVAVKHLIDHDSIQQLDAIGVEYFQLLFVQHEVVCANAVWTESFQPQDSSMGALGNAQRNEINELFPSLRPTTVEQVAAPQRKGRKLRFAFR